MSDVTPYDLLQPRSDFAMRNRYLSRIGAKVINFQISFLVVFNVDFGTLNCLFTDSRTLGAPGKHGLPSPPIKQKTVSSLLSFMKDIDDMLFAKFQLEIADYILLLYGFNS